MPPFLQEKNTMNPLTFGDRILARAGVPTLARAVAPALAFAALLTLAACGGPGQSGPAENYRVAVAQFSHETCTFCPGDDSTLEDWTRIRPPYSGDELLERGGYVGGFVHMAREFGDLHLIGLTSPAGVWGGSSRTWNAEEVFEHFVGQMLDELRTQLPVDGVFLALHGAMAVRNIPRPEAEIARRFREVVGPDVPIVATFDLHGNEDEEFLRWADGSFVVKRFPHYDSWHQGERAARYLRNVMSGDYHPTTATLKPPVVTATVLQWTGASPAMDIMERARIWENTNPGTFVSVFYGFPWADVPNIGALVQVMTDNDQELANHIATDMADFIWRRREAFASGNFPQPASAVRQAREAIVRGQAPVVLADYWDRPGDATWTLKALMDQGVDRVLYGSLTAEPTLDEIWERDLQPGDPFDGWVGGYTGEQAGSPVRIEGRLVWRGERFGYDRVAVVEYGNGSMIVLVPAYQQTTLPEQLRFGPIEPDNFDVFVLKTRAHFRRGFDDTGYAPTILLVEAPQPWFGTIGLDALTYEYGPLDRLYPFGAPDPDWLTPIPGRLAEDPSRPRVVRRAGGDG
jgi:microcystin degradation protein MlrC